MPKHLPALDGLRAVAISLVLWQHAGILFGGHGLDGWFWRASRTGWWGVDLFFVLSGLLITRILLRQGPEPGGLRAFWGRRAARTLPLLYVYLVAAAAYGFGGAYRVGEQPWLAYLTHTTNLQVARTDFGLPIFGMLWSLGVEEQFYLFWPLLTRWARRHTAAVCLALLALAPAARWAVYNLSDSYAAFHVLPFCRVDTLAMGALIATCIDEPARWRRLVTAARVALLPSIGVLAGVVALGLGPWPLPDREQTWVVGGYTLVGLSCSALVVVVAAGGRVTRALLANPLAAHVGRVSYGIYLWHCLLALCVLSLPTEQGVGALLSLWLLIVLAVASAGWFGIERRWLAPGAAR